MLLYVLYRSIEHRNSNQIKTIGGILLDNKTYYNLVYLAVINCIFYCLSMFIIINDVIVMS